jgi:hypothetical protein
MPLASARARARPNEDFRPTTRKRQLQALSYCFWSYSMTTNETQETRGRQRLKGYSIDACVVSLGADHE